MSLVTTDNKNYTDIANAIREKGGATAALKPNEMAAAIKNIKGGDTPPAPKEYKVMTAIIDLDNSNPETSVTYADDAVGMTPGDDAWDTFFGFYPVLFKDGVEVGKLNPNNFAQFEDGSPADITSGNAGDVMIAFPRRGLRIEAASTGKSLIVSMTDNPNNVDFTYWAHVRESVAIETFYLGAYQGYVDEYWRLRSLSGKTPTNNYKLDGCRTAAHNHGERYEQSAYHQLIYRQAMYILKYKNLNSQKAVGMGYCGSSAKAPDITGTTDAKGMNFGTQDSLQHMKLFGIEDFWGNLYEQEDGLVLQSSGNIDIGTTDFNNNGTGYKTFGNFSTSGLDGLMKEPLCYTRPGTGFLAQSVKSSPTAEDYQTYFSDFCWTYSYGGPFYLMYGGCYSNGNRAGVFMLYGAVEAESKFSTAGGRLMYL